MTGSFYSNHHANQRQQASEHNHAAALAECEAAGRARDHPECIAKIAEADAEDYQNTADLQAQQDMAEWSLLMLIVSAAGVVYVAQTLSATKDAVGEAANATKTAEKTLALERPWIAVSGGGCGIDIANGNFAVLVSLLNYGRTPAVDVSFERDFVLLELGVPVADLPAFESRGPEGPMSVIPPSLRTSMRPIVLSPEDGKKVMNRRLQMIIYVRVDYRSPTSLDRMTTEATLRVEPMLDWETINRRGGDGAFSFGAVGSQNSLT